MTTITTSQLCDLLAGVKSATPISFTALTVVDKLRRKALVMDYGSEVIPATPPVASRNPRMVEVPWRTLRKLVKVNAFTANRFEGAVRRQEVRESQSPTFTSGARLWGHQWKDAPALILRGEHVYLAAQVGHVTKPVYLAPSPDGVLRVIATHLVEPFLPGDTSGRKQQLERPIVRRDYRLDHIRSLTMGGERYRIAP